MKIMVAGGGTGGHLYPGLAVAAAFLRRHPDGSVVFVGTKTGIEARVVPEQGYPVETIRVEGLVGRGWMRQVRSLFVLPAAVVRAASIVGRHRPDVVLGVGGYAAGPVVLAARIKGVPIVIQEQNAVPGLTNRLLGRIAGRIAVAYRSANRWFPSGRTYLTGNPARSGLGSVERRDARRRFGLAPEAPTLFVLGGSRGARVLNENMAEAAGPLGRAVPGLQVIHQAGPGRNHEADALRGAYAKAGVPAVVLPFVEDMPAALSASDLVMARAGAATLSELALAGRPAVLVPYLFAAHGHQTANAREASTAGGAVVIDQDDLTLLRTVETLGALLSDSGRLNAMGRAMGRLARPDAADRVVDLLEEAVREARPRVEITSGPGTAASGGAGEPQARSENHPVMAVMAVTAVRGKV
ncbi:MAG: undecaprenyldiphospho-muramoylpentapeptide beta-N-acetylglucosaminyltransferase [Nitrospirae bacterium RBG_16_64_22]|nr:MAG: undecaprenyldiphospho-muramoylpentapeptide beta-N-acetylglucosaminyltransferase [Nitrospirae bacterium RBG_16_64_22]